MTEPTNYRKKQALLILAAFVCLGAAAFLSAGAPVTVGLVLATSALAFWASTLEPPKAPDEHHHH